jgi:AcrR family transcriptional regulator
MSRPADLTKQDLVEAAVSVFAAKGFEGGSVRDIARAAKANQAAVSYHFGGKDGLYREVLARSIAAFDMPALDAAAIDKLDRAEAVRVFLRAQVSSMLRREELGRYMRIFAWENIARTKVFSDFVATERLPLMELGATLVRRYLPDADTETIVTTLIWLLYQAEPFTRSPERLAQPPLKLKIDARFVERLSERLSTLVVGGLEALARNHEEARKRIA